MKFRSFILLLALCLTAGCTTVPFRETPLVELRTADPWTVVEQFRARMPESFQLLNSVVFEYNFQTFLGIGSVDINRADATFRVVCLNPMGVKLFELSGDRNSVVTHDVLPPLMEYGDLPSAVGNDIRRIYFDLIPAATAQVRARSNRITFEQHVDNGSLEFVYGGANPELMEKTYYEDDRIVWRISYYEYRDINGKLYPQGVVLVNYRHGYQLTVRQKELYS